MDCSKSLDEQRGRGPLITIIVPVFNEAGTVGEVIARLIRLPFRKEILVVNDGSCDETSVKLMDWEDSSEVRIISHATNLGKGAAIRTALLASSGTYTLIQDADLEYAPEELTQVLSPLMAGEANVVYGSRYMNPASRHPNFISHHGVKILNYLIWMLYGVRLSDHATCYKAFRTDLLRRMGLQCKGFEFCTEVTAKFARMGEAILEVPISYVPRSYAHGKKIGVTDGLGAILTLFRHRFWTEEPSSSCIVDQRQTDIRVAGTL